MISRGRVRRHLGGSKVILVRLPSRFLAKIDQHATIIGATRSALLKHLLEGGVIAYLLSQLTLAKAHHEAPSITSGSHSSE
jgi:hypothetical protein